MEFDTKAFMRQEFEQRVESVPVPALAQWFTGDGDGVCEFVVRGMTASELAKANDAASKQKNLDSVIQAIGNTKQTIKELQAVLGMSEETPAEIAKRLEQLVCCSVNPKFDYPLAVKLAQTFPVEFYILTNKIVVLTGMGMDVKKPQRSGETVT